MLHKCGAVMAYSSVGRDFGGGCGDDDVSNSDDNSYDDDDGFNI